MFIENIEGETNRTKYRLRWYDHKEGYVLEVKEKNGKYYVIEINDNPSIDSGIEDGVLKDELYSTIMQVFLQRLDLKTKGTPNVG